MKKTALPLLKACRIALNWISVSSWRWFTIIFLIALGLRVEQLRHIPSRYLTPDSQWELGAIAISMLEDGEFANPYMIKTGSTAHLPPVFPILFSLIYRIFGLTENAGYASFGFIILTYAIMYALLPWFADKFGLSKQAGFIAGLAGALILDWGGHGENLTSISLALILLAFVRRWQTGQATLRGSILLGLGIGIAFHLQPALLPVILGCMIFELWHSQRRLKWATSGMLMLGILLACLPWGWRNYFTFERVFFIRSNFGLELRMGNHAGADAAMEIMDEQRVQTHLHPRTHLAEAKRVKELGEVVYMQLALVETLTWIRNNSGTFLKLTGLRIIHFWFGPLHRPWQAALVSGMTIVAIIGAGLGLPKMTRPQRAALLIPLGTYPLVYYLVPYMARYRVPIDWILFLFFGAAIWHGIELSVQSVYPIRLPNLKRKAG